MKIKIIPTSNESDSLRNILDRTYGLYVIGHLFVLLVFFSSITFDEFVKNEITGPAIAISIFSGVLGFILPFTYLVNMLLLFTSVAYVFFKKTKDLKYHLHLLVDSLTTALFWYFITVGSM